MCRAVVAVFLGTALLSCTAIPLSKKVLCARPISQRPVRYLPDCPGTAKHGPAIMKAALNETTKNANKMVKNSQFTLTGASGIIGLVILLVSGITRLAPIALQPFLLGMSSWHWWLYAVVVLSFAYGEGYRAFQRGYAPMVVARSLTLSDRHIVVRILLATPYCMGLFHATRKRLMTSWGVLIGVNLLIVALKSVPYPYRSIVDAGAVVGLIWGTLSILIIWMRVVFLGAASTADPCLPLLSTSKKLW